MPIPVSDADRERVAEVLQQACGDGRLTLEEFSVRVGAAWAADTSAELAQVTRGLAPQPIVGSAQTVESVVTVFSESKRQGRWRLPRALKTLTVFGTCDLDLREVLSSSDVLEIYGRCLFGEVKVTVPEGVEVESAGSAVFSSRKLALAPVPRLPGTPLVRVRINVVFGSVIVRSAPPHKESSLAQLIRDRILG